MKAFAFHTSKFWRWLHDHSPISPLLQKAGMRFFFAGGVNTVVGYILYAGFVLIGLTPAMALLITSLISAVLKFFSFGIYVFGQSGWEFVMRFLLANIFIYLLNLDLLDTLIMLGSGKLAAQAWLILPLAYFSYVSHRDWVFKRKTAESEKF